MGRRRVARRVIVDVHTHVGEYPLHISEKFASEAREAWPDGFFVVPGVRPAGSGTADQKRVVSPREASEAGASILVIGRPITAAEDASVAIRDIALTL